MWKTCWKLVEKVCVFHRKLFQYSFPQIQQHFPQGNFQHFSQGFPQAQTSKTDIGVNDIMKSTELASKATEIAKKYKTCYIWGGLGRPITNKNIDQAVNQYSKNKTYAVKARTLVGKRKAFYFDCVGLVKSLLWGWKGDSTKSMGGAVYASNGVPDISADQMITKCSGISTDFTEIEVGELLWCQGHVGIYIGNGLGVECTPKFDNGVQITAVGNIGKKSGYNTRTWTKHGKLPYVTYNRTQSKTAVQPSTGSVEPANFYEGSCAGTYTVKPSALNMRKGAGTDKDIIKTIKKGERVTCYGYYSKRGTTVWLYVKHGDTVGYCSMNYLKR